jgi:dienelactone hydrolase
MMTANKPRTWLFALSVSAGLLSQAAADDATFRALSPTGNGPYPAVLLVPGCSGFVANSGINVYEQHAAELQSVGFLVVYVDYIGKRMQSNCAHVGQAEVAADIRDAVQWAAAQRDIDPSRISVIGWSYGGGGVLAALSAASAGPPIAKAVLYYPVCRGASPWPATVSGLMFVARDVPDEKLKVITYQDARHGFDMRGLPETQPRGAPAYNPAAAAKSWAAVLAFLK